MGRVGKRLLDLGTATDKIGTAQITLDSMDRHLMNEEDQSFGGKKTFVAPPKTMAAPIAPDDAVPKSGLESYTRCLVNPISETLVATKEDIDNGYILLSHNIAPGQSETLEILDFPGAVGLTLGKDYGAEEPAKMVFTGYTLGNPGAMIPGQKIAVKYNTCRKRENRYEDFPTIDLSELWGIEPYWIDTEAVVRYDYPRASPLTRNNDGIIMTAAMSGRTLYLRNMQTYQRMSVTLPILPGDVNEEYKLFFADGRLHLCQLPLMREPSNYSGRELEYLDTPYMHGAFACYVHDGNGWIEAFTAPIESEMTNGDYRMITKFGLSSFGIYGLPISDVIPWSPGKIAVINAWLSCDKSSDDEENPAGLPGPSWMTARIYETNTYTQERRLVSYASNASGRHGSARTWNCYAGLGIDGYISATGQNSVNGGSLINSVISIIPNRDYEALPLSANRHFAFPYDDGLAVAAGPSRSDEADANFKITRMIVPRSGGAHHDPETKTLHDYLLMYNTRTEAPRICLNGTHYLCELVRLNDIEPYDELRKIFVLHKKTQSAQILTGNETLITNLDKLVRELPDDPNGVEPGNWMQGPAIMGLIY